MKFGNISIKCICRACGYDSPDLIDACPKCNGEVSFEPSSVDDLRIFPKVSSMAECLDSEAAHRKAEEIFLGISYTHAYGIMEEAEALLTAILRNPKSSSLYYRTNNLEIIAGRGQRIGELAQALKTVSQLA